MKSVNRELKLFNGIKIMIGLMTVAFIMLLTSCGDDDNGTPAPADADNIVEIASASDDLESLVAALGRFPDLVTTLSDEDGTFTVFAPTDDAFAALLDALNADGLDDIADDDLREVLEYHVVAGTELLSTSLSDGATAETVQGESVAVTVLSTGEISIDEADVVTADVEAVNGIIHIIDGVLVPDGITVIAQDVIDIATDPTNLGGTTGLDSLVAAVTLFPDIVDLLSDQNEDLTVFAPTNQAFVDLLGVIGQSKLADIPEDVVERILQYHVVDGAELVSSGLTDGATAETVLEENITVGVSGNTVTINGATVTSPDVLTANGVVHIVDAVLVPSLELSIVNTIVEPAYFSKNFTILTDAVVKAELLTTLLGDGPFTLFAPNNDAFEAAGITSLDNLSGDDLEPILLYHVLNSEVFESGLPATGSAVTTLNGDFYLSINSDGAFINGSTQITVATDAGEALDYDNGVVHVIDRTLTPASQNVVEIAVSASEATEGAEFGQLVAALTAVENDATAPDLITALSDANGSFTVFAPTDAAFQALYDLVGDADMDGDNDIDDLLTATDLTTIATVLQYHVLDSRVFSTDIPNVLGMGTSATITPLAGGTWTLNDDLTITDADGALTLGSSDASIVDTDVLGTNGVIHVINQVILP